MTQFEQLMKLLADHIAQDNKLLAEHALQNEKTFAELRDGQKTILREVRETNGSIADILTELGGVPDRAFRGQRQTIRDRLHHFESGEAATKALQDALRILTTQGDRQQQNVWKNWQRWTALAGVAVAAISSLLRVWGVGG